MTLSQLHMSFSVDWHRIKITSDHVERTRKERLSYLKVLSEHLFGQNEDDCGKLRHESLCPRRNSRRVKSQIRQKHHHVSQPALFQMLLAVNTTVITLDRINHFRTGRCRSEDNIKMHLKEIGCDIMIVWIEFIWLRTGIIGGMLWKR